MRSLSALALSLTLVDLSAARVTTGSVQQREEQSNAGIVGWFSRLFKKDVEQRATLDTCVVDSYYDFVHNSTFGGNFCRALIEYPNVTVTEDFQPVTTITTKFTTQSGIQRTTIRTTPVTTATITAQPSARSKRDIAPGGLIGNGFLAYRQVAEANGTDVPGEAVLSAAFVSACNCQSYAGATVRSTRTLEPLVETVSAFDRTTTTIATTITAPTSTVYTTVPAAQSPAAGEDASNASTTGGSPTSAVEPAAGEDASDAPSTGGSSTSAVDPAAPTAPGFSCPEDDKSIVNQLVGSLRYDYLILCDTDLTGGDVYHELSYGSYSECAAACSVGDTALSQPICEGFVYYNIRDSNNCFLKNTTGSTIPAPGVDSGLLQAVAQGISEDSPQGVTTERAPFLESATIPTAEISSSLASVLSNSTTSIAVITPGPSLVLSGRLPAAAGATSYSTYVSGGSTFSTGTAFSTSYSFENGSWAYSYYTSWSQAWTSATTVYASSETSTAISNSTNVGTEIQTGNNGEYYLVSTTNSTIYFPGGYNVTQIIGNATYDADNNQITSTATTYYFTYQTGGAGGGSGGGDAGNGAGVITSTFPASTSTSISSGVSIIVVNGQTQYITYGGGAGGPQQTPAPSAQPSVITNTFGTAWSSGYIVSGINEGGGAGGGDGNGGSGNTSPTPISSTVVSGGTSGESGTAGSGAASSVPLTPISSTILSTGSGGESATEGLGSVPPFTNSINSRSGTLPPSSESTLTPISSAVVSTGNGGASSTEGSGEGPTSSATSPTPVSSTIFLTGSSGVSSTGLQGSVPSSGFGPSSGLTPSSPYSSGVFSTGISGASSTSGSGLVPSSGTMVSTESPPVGTGPTPISSTVASAGTGGASSTEGSSATPSSDTPFTNSINSRSGSLPQSSEVPPIGSIPLSTGPSSYPSSAPFTNSINSRSGSLSPSSGFPSTGSIPLSTGPSPGTVPPSSGLVPTSSPSSGVPFTNSLNSRSGSLPPSSAPSGTEFSPSSSWGTGSSLFSTGFTAPYVTGSTLSAPPGEFTESIPYTRPTGYGPQGYGPPPSAPPSGPSSSPPGTGSSGVPFTNSLNSRSGSLPPSSGTVPSTASLPTGTGSLPASGSTPPSTGSIPTGSVPLSTAPSSASSGVPFTNSINSRSGTLPTPSGTVPFSTGTGPATSPASTFPPYPTAASSCVSNFLGTTTIFTTVTHYGCYANCPPAGGAYGNTNTFGPPSFGGGKGGGRGPY